MTKGMPVEVLESRASEQRRALHNDVADLKSALRERLDVRRNVAPYVVPASGIAALIGVGLGYLISGAFTD
ncbi:MAG TPA: hypothetical protein VL382_00855 [Terriglobales bacterium]|nr:hypothetical protein [Terriglobales bacterium]